MNVGTDNVAAGGEGADSAAQKPSIAAIFVSFLRVGAVMFGGGYAMLPLLEREVVERRRWCREDEMGELYALAQAAPGVIEFFTLIRDSWLKDPIPVPPRGRRR